MDLKCPVCGRVIPQNHVLMIKSIDQKTGKNTYVQSAGPHYRADQMVDYGKYLEGQNPGVPLPSCMGRFEPKNKKEEKHEDQGTTEAH